MITAIFRFCFLIAIMYAIIGFVELDFNALRWSVPSRAVLGLFLIVVAVILAVADFKDNGTRE